MIGHTGGGGFILLLPTHLYVTGGAVVVLLSFLIAAAVPSTALARACAWQARLGVVRVPGARAWSTVASLVSLSVLVTLILAGHRGSRDPVENPLPSFVWSVWWVGLTYLHAMIGNLWTHLNPWSGLHRIAVALRVLPRRVLAYPRAAGAWPAAAGLLLFAWFELIDPAPSDPARLATAVTVYLALHFVAVALFGETAWLRHGETFSVYFRLVARLSPFAVRRHTLPAGATAARLTDRASAAREVTIGLPARRLLRSWPLGASGVAFVLIALATVSFDGLSRTFTWLAWAGVNPLDYPGRSALVTRNTAGLVGFSAVLALAYVLSVLAGERLSRGAGTSAPVIRLVLSVVPIAFGYHFAHYLPVFVVDVQQALRAASDPFGAGWDLFGTRGLHVVTSFLSDRDRVYLIWHVQVAIIVVAHVVAVWVARAIAMRHAPGGGTLLEELPLLVLMVGYTVFGLWLLSSPTAG